MELPPEASSVRAARKEVTALAEQAGAPVDDVALAVSEAVSNAVVHAFRGREAGRIEVTARVKRRKLIVVVTDDGIGMVPHIDSPGLGVGASLISQVSSEAKFRSTERGTEVTMQFEIPGWGR